MGRLPRVVISEWMTDCASASRNGAMTTAMVMTAASAIVTDVRSRRDGERGPAEMGARRIRRWCE